MSAVGLDLYCQMLADAVKVLKGERVVDIDEHPAVDLPIEAVLPTDYVPGQNQRLNLYRRFAAVESREELTALEDELVDRYGPAPDAARNLVQLAALKLTAMEAGVADVSAQDGRICVRLAEGARLGQRDQQVLEGMFKPSTRAEKAMAA